MQRANFAMAGGDVDTSMFWFGDLNLWGAFPTAPTVYQKPRSQIFYATRNWFERQVFVKSVTLVRFALFNYKFKIVSTKTATEDRVEKWFKKNETNVLAFVRDCWNEWLIQDNAIAIWRNVDGARPIIFPTEHCTYNDEFGIERLSFAHGLTAETIRGMNLPEKEKRVFENQKQLDLTKQGNVYEQTLWKYEVLKRAKVGMGLAWPKLRSIFNTVSCWEDLELADWQLAESMRTIYEMHLIGHEIKNGPHAGKNTHFLKRVRADAVRKLIRNHNKLMARVLQLVVNFDHKIEWPRPDPKHFAQDRYEAAKERLIMWAGPLGLMLFSKTLNPFLMPIFKAEAMMERDYLRPFLQKILRETMGMHEDATIVWGEEVFWDSRLLLQVMKDGLTAGPLSQTTWMQTMGFSPDMERSFKDAENRLPDHQVTPIYDPAHGPVENNGRPVGKSDSKARKTKQKK